MDSIVLNRNDWRGDGMVGEILEHYLIAITGAVNDLDWERAHRLCVLAINELERLKNVP